MFSLDVLCVGSVTVDTIAVVPALPGPDERVLATSIVTADGGPAATAAVALARLGVSVGFCGVVGNDPEGERARAQLEREGVDTRYLTVDPGVQTARGLILIPTGSIDRSIIASQAPEPTLHQVPVSVADWIHTDQTGFGPARAALTAQAGRSRLSVDGGNPLSTKDWVGVDLYVPSVSALRTHYEGIDTEPALAAALVDGAGRVVATDGANGAWIAGEGSAAFIPGFRIDVSSTLGAGDVFHGALLAGLIAGYPLERAVVEANATAAISCSQVDGRSGIPRRDELEDFLANRERDRSPAGAGQ